MNISPNEAEQALEAIQKMTHKTRQSIVGSGASISLIVTGVIWMIGFMATQFLSGEIVAVIWIAISIVGSLLAVIQGWLTSKRVRDPSAAATAKRIGLVWLLLAVFGLAAGAVAWPLDGKQLTVFTFLFIMISWTTMGLLLSFTPVWPGLVIIALVLAGYFWLPGLFFLWVAILGGGGMIVLGLYIRARW